jgi:hypothetical protein
VKSKKNSKAAPAKPEPGFILELDEAVFDRLIFEPMWTLEYIANIFRDLGEPSANVMVRSLTEAYEGFTGHFGNDDGGLLNREENVSAGAKILNEADVKAYREKLAPLFEVAQLHQTFESEGGAIYEALSILLLMSGFFKYAAAELEQLWEKEKLLPAGKAGAA